MFLLQIALATNSVNSDKLSNSTISIINFIGWFILLSFIFWIWALVDVIKRNDFKDGTTKALWALFIFFLNGLGALIYWLFGRVKKVKKTK